VFADDGLGGVYLTKEFRRPAVNGRPDIFFISQIYY
jgi:hypothetical protein